MVPEEGSTPDGPKPTSISEMFDQLQEFMKGSREALTSMIASSELDANAMSQIEGLLAELQSKIENVRGGIDEAVASTKSVLEGELAQLGDTQQIVSQVGVLKRKNTDILREAGESLDEQFQALGDLIDHRSSSLDELVTTGTSSVDMLFQQFTGKLDQCTGLIDNEVSRLKEPFDQIQGDLFMRLEEYVNKKDKELVDDIITLVIEEKWNAKKEQFESEFSSQMKMFMEFLKTTYREEFSGILRELFQNFKTTFEENLADKVPEIQQGAMAAFQSKLGGPIRETFEEFSKSISEMVGSGSDPVSLVESAFAGLSVAPAGDWDELTEFVGNLSSQVRQALQSSHQTITTLFSNGVENCTAQIEAQIQDAQMSVEQFLQSSAQQITPSVATVSTPAAAPVLGSATPAPSPVTTPAPKAPASPERPASSVVLSALGLDQTSPGADAPEESPAFETVQAPSVSAQEPSTMQAGGPTKPGPQTPATLDPTDQVIKERLDAIETAMVQPKANPKEISQELGDLRDYLLENKGYSTSLNDIRNWVTSLRNMGTFDAQSLTTVRKRMETWRESFGLGPGPDLEIPADLGSPAPAPGPVKPLATPSTTGPAPKPASATPSQPAAPTSGPVAEVIQEIDNFIGQLDKSDPKTFSKALDFLGDYITQMLGHSFVVKGIKSWAKNIQKMSKWDPETKASLRQGLDIWKQKLAEG